MSSWYAIMLADPRKGKDKLVGRRVNRAAASKIAARLNAAAVKDHGPHGPLYYVQRQEQSQAQAERN